MTRSIYGIECQNCLRLPEPRRAVYVGTTGHSKHKRNLEHLAALNRRQRTHALTRHHMAKLANTEPYFKTKDSQGHVKFNLDRYILEGLTIEKHARDDTIELLNKRGEWGRSIPRLAFRDRQESSNNNI